MSANARTEHLVTPAALEAALAGARPPVVLDVRWHLADAPGAGHQRYAAGHLPGARFLDLEAVLTRHTGDPLDGRHPLPDPATLTSGLALVGVGSNTQVVVYDEPGSFAAERAWWVLRWAGVRARVLDGGLPAWVDAGMPVETGPGPRPAEPPDQPDPLTTGQLTTLDPDAAAAFPDHGILVDARAGERFRGEVEPLDPAAGHIPGAVNASAATLFTPDGRLPDDDAVRSALGPAATGDRAVAVYCGSGVSAARDVLGLAVIGVEAGLFPGSWSAWSNDPQRPVATGAARAQPGDRPVDNPVEKRPAEGD
ncbi:MAG: sulfurtransferase [Lapillicoccus sp.]